MDMTDSEQQVGITHKNEAKETDDARQETCAASE